MNYRLFSVAVFLVGFSFAVQAQKPTLKMEEYASSAISTPNAEVAALKRPVNDKTKPVSASPKKVLGDQYGADYSDLVFDNWTGLYIEIYVNGKFRGMIDPYGEEVTWAIPGTNTVYAKATYRDGSYSYWGPRKVTTGYKFTWRLNP